MNRNEEIKITSSVNLRGSIPIVITTLLSGFGMWVLAGLWHNLIVPLLDPKVTAHHDGLFLMLVAYFILSFLMVVLYLQKSTVQKNRVVDGFIFGLTIGILWVFPHGLSMAGVHNTSIMYEIKNVCWHLVEQGIGGIMIAALAYRFGINS